MRVGVIDESGFDEVFKDSKMSLLASMVPILKQMIITTRKMAFVTESLKILASYVCSCRGATPIALNASFPAFNPAVPDFLCLTVSFPTFS